MENPSPSLADKLRQLRDAVRDRAPGAWRICRLPAGTVFRRLYRDGIRDDRRLHGADAGNILYHRCVHRNGDGIATMIPCRNGRGFFRGLGWTTT